jgi:hypothetical protein
MMVILGSMGGEKTNYEKIFKRFDSWHHKLQGLEIGNLTWQWKILGSVVECSHSQCQMVDFTWIFSCICFHRVSNSLPCQVWPHRVTLKWKKDCKKESLWKRKTTRKCEKRDVRGRPWERERWRESRTNMTQEEQYKGRVRERKERSKRNEEIGNEWEGNATLITIFSSFIQLLDENIFYPIMNKRHVTMMSTWHSLLSWFPIKEKMDT